MISFARCLSLVSILALVNSGTSKILTSSAQLSNKGYDFVIVGGGTAGNVIANRLTENPRIRVLVLEAGSVPDGIITLEVPFLSGDATPNTPQDWNFTTTPQVGLGGRAIPYPRGHVLGGTSSVNFLVYTRGSEDDWNRFAKVTDDKGWSWNNILPYFKRSESWTPPADHHNTAGQFDPSVHGKNGPVSVSLNGFKTPVDGMTALAEKELRGAFEFNIDQNSGKPLGMGFTQSTINDGVRSSSATSYLAPKFLNRSNLDVLINTYVTRVVQTRSVKSIPAFQAVEFSQHGSAGPLIQITARKEIILSAGAIGTPQILLNSGIGNTTTLKALGIKPLVNLPNVGRNLTDHAAVLNPFVVNSTDTFDSIFRNQTLEAADLALWKKHTGPMVSNVLSQLGFMRVPPNVYLPSPDNSAGFNSPHFEIAVAPGIPFRAFVPPAGNFITVSAIVVSPSSRGSVTLSSPHDPFSKPIIDPALLATPYDKAIMRQGIRNCVQFASAKAFSGYVLGPIPALANATTSDAALDDYATASAVTIFHPSGTAKMSAKSAEWGVVNPDLLVKKVTGLRIVDASVFPFTPSAHLQAPVYALAERAADLIKARYSLFY